MHLAGMLVRNRAASSHRLWRPCSHRRRNVGMKGRCRSCSIFWCCGIVSYTKHVKDIARSNNFLFIRSHQDPSMIDWYHERLNPWTCMDILEPFEPGWLGNWSHKDTATPQHWLFSRQGTVMSIRMSMLIPCQPALCLVPADLINNEKIEHKVTWQLMCMYIVHDNEYTVTDVRTYIYIILYDISYYVMCVCVPW